MSYQQDVDGGAKFCLSKPHEIQPIYSFDPIGAGCHDIGDRGRAGLLRDAAPDGAVAGRSGREF